MIEVASQISENDELFSQEYWEKVPLFLEIN